MSEELEGCLGKCGECGTYCSEVEAKQARIDELNDLVEWFKHQLSEQAWHWTEVVKGLNLQLKHERKSREFSTLVANDQVNEGETEYIAGNLWAQGQKS